MRTATQLLVVILWPVVALAGENWPEFRGPTADGQSDAVGLPLTWSETENVAWKTPIHDRGWSSPVVWGSQVWVTTASEDGRKLFAVCVDSDTGKVVHDLHLFDVEEPQQIAKMNTYASPTPAIEAGRVYVHYGTYGTACLDTQTGQTVWARRDLNCEHHMGPGSSLALFDDLLIFHVDGMDVQYVIALDKKTGKTAWKTDRSVDYTFVMPFCRKAFCMPTFIPSGDRVRMISPGGKGVMAYDPLTGEELWKVRYFGWSVAPRPVFGHGMVFVVIDYDHPELWAIRLGGQGDVTDTHVEWRIRKGMPNVSSLLLIDGLLYMVNEMGLATCVEAETGEIVWQKRMEESFWASPVYVDGRIYWFDRQADATVTEPGREFKKLAFNELDDLMMASPAVAGKAFFLRTSTHLYRIEQ
jgi:outer membrane protein assembly factor BamB